LEVIHRVNLSAYHEVIPPVLSFVEKIINLCLRGGLGWWFGSLGIDGFVNLEKTKNIKPCKQ